MFFLLVEVNNKYHLCFLILKSWFEHFWHLQSNIAIQADKHDIQLCIQALSYT